MSSNKKVVRRDPRSDTKVIRKPASPISQNRDETRIKESYSSRPQMKMAASEVKLDGTNIFDTLTQIQGRLSGLAETMHAIIDRSGPVLRNSEESQAHICAHFQEHYAPNECAEKTSASHVNYRLNKISAEIDSLDKVAATLLLGLDLPPVPVRNNPYLENEAEDRGR